MNKAEFLEILRDYLKKDFSEDEVNDILRDYEEYFVDGIIEGKSDMEIISALGSPKSIAKELISQTKGKDEDKLSGKDFLSEKFGEIKIWAKEKYSKSKEYISDKLTPDLRDKGHGLSRKLIKLVIIALSLMLIMPAFGFIIAMITAIAGVAATLIGFIIAIPFIINLIWSTPQISGLLIFASITFIGIQIIIWQIIIFIIKIAKTLLKRYLNWIRTRNIYIDASKRKEELEKEELKEEDFYYEGDIYDREGDIKDE